MRTKKNFKLGQKVPALFISLKSLLGIKTYEVPSLKTQGVSNLTYDRMFVLFADYDDTNLEVVEEDARWLQTNYNIGDLIIVSSSEQQISETRKIYGNYHLIGFTKLLFPDLIDILRYLRCDWHFKKGWRYQFRTWVLRTTEKKDYYNNLIKEKPSLVTFMPNISQRIYSQAHIEFFEKLYDFEINRKECYEKKKSGKLSKRGIAKRILMRCLDGSSTVEIINYVTR